MIHHGIVAWILGHAYLGLFLSLVLGVAFLPLPDEAVLAMAGSMVANHHLQWIPALVTCWMGAWCGITLSYGTGRLLPLRWIKHPAFHRAEQWYHTYGPWTLFTGYFVPGLRHLTALVAGASRMPFPTFVKYAYSGGMLWSTSLLVAGYFLGREWSLLIETWHHHFVLISLTGVFLVGAGGLIMLRRAEPNMYQDKQARPR